MARVQSHCWRLATSSSSSISLQQPRSSTPKWRSSSPSSRRAYHTFFPFFPFTFSVSSPIPIAASRMSTDATQEQPLSVAKLKMEPLEVRWMHTGTKHLALPTAPITAVESAYKAFSVDESDRIERGWEVLPKEQRAKIERRWARGDGEWSAQTTTGGRKESGEDTKEIDEGPAPDPETPPASDESVPDSPEDKAEIYKSIIERARSDPSKLDAIHGVPVSQVRPLTAS